MYCCWAGKDGVFNRFEFARALGVYSTFLILSPIHMYISWCFYNTRKNYEMRVREPNVVILMSLLIWIRLICESMYQLTLNLDEEGSNDFQITTWIFNILHWLTCILILGLYFFRVWMFWYNSVKSRKAAAFVESNGYLGSFSSNQKWDVDSCSRPRYLTSLRKIVAVSIFWVVIWMTLIAIVYFAMDCTSCVQRYQLSLIALCPFVVKSFLLLRGVKNQFDIISEHIVVISLVLINFGLNVSLESLWGLKDSYWRALIDYLFRAVWLCCYLLWLLNSVRKYALDSLKGRKNRSHLSLWNLRDLCCIKSEWCCSARISELKQHGPITWDLGLPDILSQQSSFNLFRFHLEETLCPENLLFFVDVYIHRKQLEDDPFLTLTENENNIIKESARVKMKWIDEEARASPTVRDIYNLYVKPFSDLQINIAGNLREKLVALFEVTPTKNTERLTRSQSLQIPPIYRYNRRARFSATVFELRSSLAMGQSLLPEQVGREIDSRLLSPSYPFQKGFSSVSYQIELSEIKIPRKTSERHGGFSITLNEVVESSENSDSQDSFLHSGDLSIAHLYPVWKTSVNLLRNDSLIRFKNKHYIRQRKRSVSV